MEYGLIGEKLGHSYSKPIHEQLAGYNYTLKPLADSEFDSFMQSRDFKAINVTIPYKQRVMPYCDEIDEAAKRIGAVNTIVNENGRLKGYNTDCAGLKWLLKNGGVELKGRRVLLLGNGATAKTAAAAAQDCGASQVILASRNPKDGVISYEEAAKNKDVNVIINTSPNGMYPSNMAAPLVEPAAFPKLEAVADVVYNPLRTRLVMEAEKMGIPALNGLGMLVAQAKYSCEYFTGQKMDDSRINEILLQMLRQTVNVVLVGMPGCGKSTLGNHLAKKLGRDFVDTDKVIVQESAMEIPDIFAAKGEETFRDYESSAALSLGAQSGLVIATGGGIVKRDKNIRALRQNGIVIFLDRPLEYLAIGGGRPLSQSREDVEALAEQRLPLYKNAADIVFRCHKEIGKNADRLFQEFERYTAGMV